MARSYRTAPWADLAALQETVKLVDDVRRSTVEAGRDVSPDASSSETDEGAANRREDVRVLGADAHERRGVTLNRDTPARMAGLM